MISYLTGAHNESVAAVAHERNIGLLVQPGNRYDLQVHRYPTWAGDNGAFTTKAGGFSASGVAGCARPRVCSSSPRTVVGDAQGTLDQFPAWAAEIKADIFNSTDVLVYFDRPSVGTAMEILHAWTLGRRVWVANVSGKPPSPWLVYHSHNVSNSLQESIASIRMRFNRVG